MTTAKTLFQFLMTVLSAALTIGLSYFFITHDGGPDKPVESMIFVCLVSCAVTLYFYAKWRIEVED